MRNVIKIKGYCLTLQNSVRHERMRNKLDKIKNLPYEFVYGKKFEKQFVHNFVDVNLKVWHMSNFSNEDSYIQRAFSCADGHRRILEKFLNQTEYNWAFIMQDDLDVDTNVIQSLEYIIKKYEHDWYHLSTQAFYNYVMNKRPRYEELPRVKIMKSGKSTLAYLVNKTFAMTYYKALSPIVAPSDITLWMLNRYVPVVENINLYFSDDQHVSLISTEVV